MRIGIAGVAGRMGHAVAEAARAVDFTLSGGTCRAGETPPPGVAILADIAALAAESDVVIDFTNAATVQPHAAALAAAGVAWIVGTTGLSDADQHAVWTAAGAIPVVQAANFSAGVNLVLALAERLGATLPAETYDAEIIEMHHRHKVDAPSGTALALGEAVAKGRGVRLSTVAQRGRDGHTGPRVPGTIGFATLRGGQVVGEHTLLFAAGDEHISITHRAFDRMAFARGAVRAAVWVHGKPPGLYGMRHVLGMEPLI